MLFNFFLKIFRKQFIEYIPVMNIFAPPKIKFFILPWKKNPLLPVWRHNLLYISKKYDAEYDVARLVNCNWKDDIKKKYPVLTKIFKPVYNLPLWLHFGIFSSGLGWKTKYSEYRYEWNPFWYINIFGISFGFTVVAPSDKNNKYIISDSYWEAILNCQDLINTLYTDANGIYIANNYDELKNIILQLNYKAGIWNSYEIINNEQIKTEYQALQSDFFIGLAKYIFDTYFKKENIITKKIINE